MNLHKPRLLRRNNNMGATGVMGWSTKSLHGWRDLFLTVVDSSRVETLESPSSPPCGKHSGGWGGLVCDGTTLGDGLCR